MSKKEPLNTAPIQQFIARVKAADNGQAREVKLDIQAAKNLAFTLGIVMSRLEGNLEELLATGSQEIITIDLNSKDSW